MKIAFRVDASLSMGTGHVVRCVALAQALLDKGRKREKGKTIQENSVRFLCRPQPGDMISWVESQGFPVERLAETPEEEIANLQRFFRGERTPYDWLIVDHYGLDAAWEKALEPYTRRILAIDDLANRPHTATYLVDQNWLRLMEGEKAYRAFMPAKSTLWLGPRHALLRLDFAIAHVKARFQRDLQSKKPTERLLVFFGGTDPTQETLPAIGVLKELFDEKQLPHLKVDVVVGSGNPKKAEIEAFCEGMPQATFHCQTEAMADLMLQADWALCAGGATTWERLCLGLPGLIIGVADNQIPLSQAVAEEGQAQVFLGISERLESSSAAPKATLEKIKEALLHYLKEDAIRWKMAQAGLNLVDGMGARHVAELMRAAVTANRL